MTTITFEYPCGEYQDGWFNINGTTIATGTLIEIKGDTAIVQFDSARHETGLEPGQTIKIPVDQVMEQLAGAVEPVSNFEAFVDAVVFAFFDTYHCPKCGQRSKSQGQVVDDRCSACGSIVEEPKEEIPF